MNSRELDPGELPKEERSGRRDRHLLALTGGGYRGLFSAEVLAAAEADSGDLLAKRFDMISGTSVGGILAIGIACGVSARDLAEFVRELGPAIFQPRRFSFAGFSKSRYGSAGLRRAIEVVLGQENAQRPFSDIPVPLVVSAVHEGTGTPHLFRSTAAATGKGDDVTTLDVALATSAAPTYFPPHRIGNRVYVDGGLVANAPDLVVLTEASRIFGSRLEDCHLLSVGTAGALRDGAVEGAPGKIGWLTRHTIIDLIMTAQEALAIDQVRCLRPSTFLRIDATPPVPIKLDDTSAKATEMIIALAQSAIEHIQHTQKSEWRRFLSYLAN